MDQLNPNGKKNNNTISGSDSFFPLYFQFSVMRRDFARLLILTLGNNATAVKIK